MDNHGWVMNKGTIITHVTLSICVFFKILEFTTYSWKTYIISSHPFLDKESTPHGSVSTA